MKRRCSESPSKPSPALDGLTPESSATQKTGEYIFYDCSAESPKGRRSVCYDREALESRKEHKPEDSVIDMAAAMGIELLTEEQYRDLQKLRDFDTKTKLWSQEGRTKFEKLPLSPWASRRRQELLELLDRMNPTIAELTAAVDQEAKNRGVAADDASWCGAAHGPGLCADHRNSDAVSLWQADRQLLGNDSE